MEASPQLTHRQIMVVLSGLMLGMFLAALDQTIVSTAIRTIADDLHGLTIQAWATTAYLITSTITTPLYGKLSDIYGRKPFFLAAITIFVIGSVLCGFAGSMYQLAFFRGIQGIGAGGLFSLALAILGDIVPPRERARYQGMFIAVFGTSSVLGPIVGGFLAGQSQLFGITGWRWVFLVNVPIGLIALFVVFKVLNVHHHRHDHAIDWWGATALVTALLPLLLVLEQGREWGWTSTRSLLCAAIGLIGLVAFYFAERRVGDEALLPLRLFGGRTFSIGAAMNFVVGVGMFGGLAIIPLYLQIVKGKSPTEAGLLLLPLVLGIMTASMASGQIIARTGKYKVLPIIGFVLLIIGSLALSRLSVDLPYWQTAVGMVLFGLGLGFNMQPLVLAIQNASDPRDMGVATSSATFFRQMGGTVGTAIFLSILFSTAATNIGDEVRTATQKPEYVAALRAAATSTDPGDQKIAAMMQHQKANPGAQPELKLDDSSFLTTANPALTRPFRQGFSDSMQLLLLSAAGVLVIGLALSFFLPQLPLRHRAGAMPAAE